MTQASATRPRHTDGIATSVLLVLAALVQLLKTESGDPVSVQVPTFTPR